jgi:hypothetical protein
MPKNRKSTYGTIHSNKCIIIIVIIIMNNNCNSKWQIFTWTMHLQRSLMQQISISCIFIYNYKWWTMSGLHCSDCSMYVLFVTLCSPVDRSTCYSNTMLPPSLGYKWAWQGCSLIYTCHFLHLFCWTHGEINDLAMLILYARRQDTTKWWFLIKRRPFGGRVQARCLTQGMGKDRTYFRLITVNQEY